MGDRKNARLFPNAGSGRQRRWSNKPILTPRQSQFVKLMIDGMNTVEIASHVGVSQQNVTEVLRDALFRTGLRTYPQIAAWWALRNAGASLQRTA